MIVDSKLIAAAQVVLSIVFLVGYFSVLTLFILGKVNTPADWKDALTVLLGVLTAGVGTILAYWFSRSRAHDSTS